MSLETLCSLASAGDAKALNSLVEILLPSVTITSHSIKGSREFSGLQLDIDDMIQEGSIALLRAVEHYDSSSGVLFRTFAETVVRNAITDYVRRTQAEYNAFGTIVSLDAAIEDSDDDSRSRSFEEIILNEHTKTPEQIFIERETQEEIHHALNQLSAREREYLCYRFGFDDDQYHDRTESAYHFHLSKSRAKKLEENALDNFYLELPWWY
ncbi:MAG: sigma-70 family RNA polymerase sigma factor [Eubacteriales bacterium]|nr:sigma-70 family RNA polymerase sigma factor [Eubacteriales bacterium]